MRNGPEGPKHLFEINVKRHNEMWETAERGRAGVWVTAISLRHGRQGNGVNVEIYQTGKPKRVLSNLTDLSCRAPQTSGPADGSAPACSDLYKDTPDSEGHIID